MKACKWNNFGGSECAIHESSCIDCEEFIDKNRKFPRILKMVSGYLDTIEDYMEGTLLIKHHKVANSSELLILYSDTDLNTYGLGYSHGEITDDFFFTPITCSGCHKLISDGFVFKNLDEFKERVNINNIGRFEFNKVYCKHCSDINDNDEEIMRRLIGMVE